MRQMLFSAAFCNTAGGGFILLFSIVCAGAAVCLVRNRSVDVNRKTVVIPDLPPEFNGFRIALISDLHDREFCRDGEALVRLIRRNRADILVMAGDMHGKEHSPEPFYRLLKQLSLPMFFTDGNHDLPPGHPDRNRHLRRLSALGVTILNDRRAELRKGNARIVLAGQSWHGMLTGKNPLPDPEAITVFICHDPLQFDRLPVLPDLMLSGHVHGGIIPLPGGKALFAPGNGISLFRRLNRNYFFPKYHHNLYRKKNHVLAVTTGLGFSVLPIRFLPPELMILELRRTESGKIS